MFARKRKRVRGGGVEGFTSCQEEERIRKVFCICDENKKNKRK